MELTIDQLKIIRMYAFNAKVDSEQVIEWVKQGKCTIAELSMWILWMPV